MTHIEIQSSYMTLILEAEHSFGHSLHPVYLYVRTMLTPSQVSLWDYMCLIWIGWSTGNLLSRPWQQIHTSLCQPDWSVEACPSIKCIEMTALPYGHHGYMRNSGWTQDFKTYMSCSCNYLFLLWTNITQHIIFLSLWNQKKESAPYTERKQSASLGTGL